MSPLLNERRKALGNLGKADGRTKTIANGIYVVKGAASKAGTKLTRERIAGNFRSLYRRPTVPPRGEHQSCLKFGPFSCII